MLDLFKPDFESYGPYLSEDKQTVRDTRGLDAVVTENIEFNSIEDNI